jgi:tRNA nucleotidyltransferase (CCA-adding enzyme)
VTITTADAGALRERLFASIPVPARDAVERIIAAAGSATTYAAGGAVRDLLLDAHPVDIDLVIEGDAIAVTRAALPAAKITSHARFGTASAIVGGLRIDVAAARGESYARPGALPAVAPAPILVDLGRRDFSINAIALRLNGAPAVIDPCGGADDVAARLIRVLHDGSFADDATRIFRALRYSARLRFTIEPHTAALLRESAAYLAAIGGERLRRELELMLGEASAGEALEACDVAGALRAVHPALAWDTANTRALGAADDIAPRIDIGFALLASQATAEQAEAISARLRLTRAETAAVRGIAAMRGLGSTLRRPEAKPSGIVVLLDRFPAAAVAAFGAVAGDPIVRTLVQRYLAEWRHVKPWLSGLELQALGVPKGPQVQRGLQLIRAARLDGWASDRGDEHALALRFAKSIRDSAAAKLPVELRIYDN